MKLHVVWMLWVGLIWGGSSSVWSVQDKAPDEPPVSTDALVQRTLERLLTPAGEGNELESAFVPPSRDVLRPYILAGRSFQQKKWGLAAIQLGELIADEASPDQLLPLDRERAVSLKRAARRMMAQIPVDQLADYHLKFATLAEQKLAAALEQGDTDALAEVGSRYGFTPAGMQAAMLAASQAMERGDLVSATAMLSELVAYEPARQAFDPEASVMLAACYWMNEDEGAARETLLRLRARQPAGATVQATVRFLDQPRAIPTEANQLLPWLADLIGQSRLRANRFPRDWTLVAGNPQRTGTGSFGMPLLVPQWSVSLYSTSEEEEHVRQFRNMFQSGGRPIVPSAQPLVVGNTLVARTPQQLVGLDFSSGEVIWKFPPDNPLIESEGRVPAGSRPVGPPFSRDPLRMMENSTAGEASSDGTRVFTIPRVAAGYLNSDLASPNQSGPDLEIDRHMLKALRLDRQGALAWQVGGVTGGDEPELRETFFLGPPLPQAGVLYAIALQKTTVVLTALEADTGKLLWKQALGVMQQDEYSGLEDSEPLFGALSPSLSNGVLVCPTGEGTLVGVSLADRSLIWGFGLIESSGGIDPFSEGPDPDEEDEVWVSQRGARTWLDSRVLIDRGKVVFTPRGSNRMVVVNLLDGEPVVTGTSERLSQRAWSHLFVGGLFEGNAILVGQDDCQAINLATGNQTWRLKWEDYGVPSGTGFQAEGVYYQPMSAGYLLQIDLRQGKLSSAEPTPQILGNLISVKGQMVAQGIDRVLALIQDGPATKYLESLSADQPRAAFDHLLQAQLAAKNGNWEAAAVEGEAAWSGQASAVAVELLRNVYGQLLKNNPGYTSPVFREFLNQQPKLNWELQLGSLANYPRSEWGDRLQSLIQGMSGEEWSDPLPVTDSSGWRTCAWVRRDRYFGSVVGSILGKDRDDPAWAQFWQSWEAAQVPSIVWWNVASGLGFENLSDGSIETLARRFQATNPDWAEGLWRELAARPAAANAERGAFELLRLWRQQGRWVEARAWLTRRTWTGNIPEWIAERELILNSPSSSYGEPAPWTAPQATIQKLTRRDWKTEDRVITGGLCMSFDTLGTPWPETAEPRFRYYEDRALRMLDPNGNLVGTLDEGQSTTGGAVADTAVEDNGRGLRAEIQDSSDWNGDDGSSPAFSAVHRGNCTARGRLRLLQVPGATWMVALNGVDGLQAQLLWKRPSNRQEYRARFATPAGFGVRGSLIQSTAIESTLTEWGEALLIENGKLHCLEASTGNVIWTSQEEVSQGHLVLQGRRALVLNASTGSCIEYALADGEVLGRRKVPAEWDVLGGTGELLMLTRHLPKQVELVGWDPLAEQIRWTRPLQNGTVAQFVGDQQMVLVPRHQPLEILELRRGETLRTCRVPYEQMSGLKVLGVDLYQDRDRLLVAYSTKAPEMAVELEKVKWWIRLLRPGYLGDLTTGYLVSYPLAGEAPQWSAPVRFEGLQWCFPEPIGSPFLVGVRRLDLNSFEREVEHSNFQLMFVDLRQGRLFEEASVAPTFLTTWNYQWDRDSGRFRFQFGLAGFDLVESAEPPPPGPPSQLSIRRALPSPTEWLTVTQERAVATVARNSLLERLRRAQQDLEQQREDVRRQLQIGPASGKSND